MNAKGAKAVAKRTADRVYVLEPSAYKSSWKAIPKKAEEIGLRLISLDDGKRARTMAAAEGRRRHPKADDVLNRIDAERDALAGFIVAFGCCKVADVEVPYWQAAEDNVPLMLRTEAIEVLAFRIDAYAKETSPTVLVASDEDVAWLAARLAHPDTFAGLNPIEQSRTRKLLAYVMEGLRSAG